MLNIKEPFIPLNVHNSGHYVPMTIPLFAMLVVKRVDVAELIINPRIDVLSSLPVPKYLAK